MAIRHTAALLTLLAACATPQPCEPVATPQRPAYIAPAAPQRPTPRGPLDALAGLLAALGAVAGPLGLPVGAGAVGLLGAALRRRA